MISRRTRNNRKRNVSGPPPAGIACCSHAARPQAAGLTPLREAARLRHCIHIHICIYTRMDIYVYQTQNPHKSNKMTLISRHVYNSKRRTKRFLGKTPEIPGNFDCLKKDYQTQNPHKFNKIIFISRHVFKSKRRTKRFTSKSPANPGN